MIESSAWAHAAGVAPQFGPSPAPRQHRYAPKPETDHTSWRDEALCAQVDADLFFPEKGGSSKEPKKVCRACPVRAECLEDSLADGGERFGIRGGLSERERRKLIKDREAA